VDVTPANTTPKAGPAASIPDVLAIDIIRAFLHDAPYDEANVCARAGAETIYDLQPIEKNVPHRVEIAAPLDLLIHLFLDSRHVSVKVARDVMGRNTLDAFLATGLLRQRSSRRIEPAVLLYPTGSLHVVSDLRSACRKRPGHPPMADAVYPAITPNTRLFVAGLPTGPCDRLLEMCAGTGIGALLGARHAGHAWSADITERATRFAAFNAALNGIANFTAVRGDLWEPVRGMQFDRILAHPPYVPARSQEVVFRDGGDDGEWITRGILAGLADHLAPGGTLYCTCAATDRTNSPFEQRVRTMLGEKEGGFDIVFVVANAHDVKSYCGDLMVDPEVTRAEATHTLRTYRRLGVEKAVVGSLVIRRHEQPMPALTLRRPMGDTPATKAADQLLWWERRTGHEETLRSIVAASPRVAPGVTRQVTQAIGDSGWAIRSCRYSTQTPFSVTLDPAPAVIGFMEMCDGGSTVGSIVDRLKREGRIEADAPPVGFAGIVRSLAAGGFLDLGPDWPSPDR
jgi:Methyltransferase small domain